MHELEPSDCMQYRFTQIRSKRMIEARITAGKFDLYWEKEWYANKIEFGRRGTPGLGFGVIEVRENYP